MIPEGREILEKMQINLHDSDNRVSDFHYHYHYFWCFLTTHVGPDSLRHVHGRKVEIDISFALQVSRKQHRIFYFKCINQFLILMELHVARKFSVENFTTTFKFKCTVKNEYHIKWVKEDDLVDCI